jgi:hypothetical protein
MMDSCFADESLLLVDGAYRDLIEMGMLQHEWVALQAKKAEALVTAS